MSFKLHGKLPYCPGCGHHQIARCTADAFDEMEVDPKDVVLVTDIGCVGLADKYFPCHTVHGLHGRATALATGLKVGLDNPDKKVVVFVGDGGATIGLQHLLESARLNVDINIVLHNNMLYGMTGGQSSGLTPCGYRTTTEPQGSTTPHYDVPQLAHKTGARYTQRILFRDDVVRAFQTAFSTSGCSLVEVVEYCYSYGSKYNPNKKIEEILDETGLNVGVWENKEAELYEPGQKSETEPLLDKLPSVEPVVDNSLSQPLSVLVGGSAGEGVQTACGVLSRAGMMAGLEVTKKGEYPVTVGSGFSTSKVILSPTEIMYNGIEKLQVAIIVSPEGLNHSKSIIASMNSGDLYIDNRLEVPRTDSSVSVHRGDFRKEAGAKGAALCAIAYWLNRGTLFSPAVLTEAAKESKHADALVDSINKAKEI